jgi:hypothetical protein
MPMISPTESAESSDFKDKEPESEEMIKVEGVISSHVLFNNCVAL